MRFIALILLTSGFLLAAAASYAAESVSEETCKIRGTITKKEQWLHSPYKQAPSAFSDLYIRLTVDISESALYESYHASGGAGFCDGITTGQSYSFRLCAAENPEVGDVISGVIGPVIGAADHGCLFDVETLSNVRNDKPAAAE